MGPASLISNHLNQAFGFLLATLLLATSAQSTQQDEDVVRVNTDLVVLNLTVTDKSGQYVQGLRISDFKVYEDGKEVDAKLIASFSLQESPYASVVLLDSSGSMEARLSLARSAAIHFLDGLRDEDVAAVYSFDSKIEQLQDFSPSRDLAPVAFQKSAKGMTVLNDAVLRAATELSHRPEKRRAIVVLSDGADTYSSASMDKALTAALNAGATIYTVDMSSPEDPNLQERAKGTAALRNFANKSGGRYVSTPG